MPSAALARVSAGGVGQINLGDGRLTIRSFKILLDGALGSRGAEMTKPYADAPDERGLRLMDDAAVDKLVRASLEKGFQVNAHAIGDRAVTRALDAYERGGVRREHRFRIDELRSVYGDLVLSPVLPERSAISQAQGSGRSIQSWPTPGAREVSRIFAIYLERLINSKTTAAPLTRGVR